MTTNKSLLIDEEILKTLGARTIKLFIHTKGRQLEEDILSKLQELENMVMQGFSNDGLVTATLNGNHEVLDISMVTPLPHHLINDPVKMCHLVAEAVNDGLYKINETIENEISIIKKNYVKEVIEKSSQK